MRLENISKTLSYILRHDPGSIGLSIDGAGWVNVEELIHKSRESGKCRGLDLSVLKQIVAQDAKTRYSFNHDGTMIRANQGHSIKVDLGLSKAIPPVKLYHGTNREALPSIMKEGLKKMRRHHVHLTSDPEQAKIVGGRRGKVVLLEINTKKMVAENVDFYLSDNKVWLVDCVSPKYLTVVE